MKERIFFGLVFLLTTSMLTLGLNIGQTESSEPPAIEWSQTYGGPNDENAECVIQTVDGGYAIVGPMRSFGAGGQDFWLVKTDSAGNHLWNKTYGGVKNDYPRCLIQTVDGGYVIAGYTLSFGAGSWDFWLAKVDASGNHQWNKTYGGSQNEHATFVIQTADGGYAVAGTTTTLGAGSWDFWLVKTNATGDAQWNQTYGGTSDDLLLSMVKTVDEGYALTGPTQSFGAGSWDFWLVKVDSHGNQEWNETYGGALDDHGPYSVVQTSDEGYALAGYTRSFGPGNNDFWLVKTDATGNHLWNKTYGGANNDCGLSMVQTSDGGYAVAGYTHSFGVEGTDDGWLVKTDSAGNHLWNKTYGGVNEDYAYSVVQTYDGGYVTAGYTNSFGAEGHDFWLIKIASTVTWEYTFQDPCRNTVLKISTDDQYFQFIAPDKSFSMKHDPDMDVYEYCGFTCVTISYEDDEIELWAFALDGRFDFCIVYAEDKQTDERYLLIDKLGIE